MANEQVLQKLELLQNQALRLVTGAVKSTPINAMLLLTNSKTIKAIIKEKALIRYEKLIRTKTPYWMNYPRITRNLKTQKMAVTVNRAIDEYFPPDGQYTIIAEPGRYVVTSSFTLCTNIIGKKERKTNEARLTNQDELKSSSAQRIRGWTSDCTPTT
ncbi:hypothetical protein CEXT_307641 [Caerostris extrusa]|uniref:Orn/DAP/Arg decarboxylase 2 N-terminal domain-containing protein n=1 Tax=Caerostris extrusa TaxID=172846 RepID=A0AAV4WGL0_CAEEX|nr:hypothetical protein CEXT_307641 [Caerostris extrusa]